MGYIDAIVNSGLALAEDKGVVQFVEKARSLKAIDQAYDLVLQHGPMLVETLDRKVDLTLEKKNEIVDIADKKKTLVLETVDKKKAELAGFADEKKARVAETVDKTKALVHENFIEKKALVLDTVDAKKAELAETVDKTKALVHEKKALVLETVDAKKALVLETVDKTKASVLEAKDATEAAVRAKALTQLTLAQAKKQEYVTLAYAKADDAAAAKADLVRKLLSATAGTAAAPAAEYLVLIADIVIVKTESAVRKGLQLPVTLKDRMAERPSVEQARELVFDFAQTKIYRPLSVQYTAVAVFVLDGKQQLTAAAALRFAAARAQLVSAQDRFAQDPRFAKLTELVKFEAEIAQMGLTQCANAMSAIGGAYAELACAAPAQIMLSARTAQDRYLQLAQHPRFAEFTVYAAHAHVHAQAYVVVLQAQKAVLIVYAQQAQEACATAAETAKAKVAELYKSHTA